MEQSSGSFHLCILLTFSCDQIPATASACIWGPAITKASAAFAFIELIYSLIRGRMLTDKSQINKNIHKCSKRKKNRCYKNKSGHLFKIGRQMVKNTSGLKDEADVAGARGTLEGQYLAPSSRSTITGRVRIRTP